LKRDQIPLATIDGRHAGELLAHPCDCGRHRCTLGDHIWQATRDMTPGIRAKSYEPSTIGALALVSDDPPPPDPTSTIDTRFAAAVQAYWDAARALTRLIDAHRPDRWTPLPDPTTDTDWCTNHLQTIGQCEPRYRGDECRMCYDLRTAHGHLPDQELMEIKHLLGYVPTKARDEWLQRLPKPKRRKGKRAS